jgi:hypothetical protein
MFCFDVSFAFVTIIMVSVLVADDSLLIRTANSGALDIINGVQLSTIASLAIENLPSLQTRLILYKTFCCVSVKVKLNFTLE